MAKQKEETQTDTDKGKQGARGNQGESGATQSGPADTGASQGAGADQGNVGASQGAPADTGAPQGTPSEPAATGAEPVDDKVDEPVDDKIKKTGGKQRRQYAFPTVSRCPRCGTTDTKATSTKGPIQYRECRRAICRWKYTVRGTKV